jgi:hypothetical protein
MAFSNQANQTRSIKEQLMAACVQIEPNLTMCKPNQTKPNQQGAVDGWSVCNGTKPDYVQTKPNQAKPTRSS